MKSQRDFLSGSFFIAGNSLSVNNIDEHSLTDQVIKKIIAVLTDQTHVCELYLSSLVIQKNDLKKLGDALAAAGIKLNNLSLYKNSLSKESIPSLDNHAFSHLTILSLEYNHIKDEGTKLLLDFLRHQSKLEALRLKCCGIKDQGAKEIAKFLMMNSSLIDLDLSYNEIKTEGLRALAYAIGAHHQNLKRLSLEGGKLTPDETKELVRMLKTTTSLTQLELGRNSIGDEGAQLLSRALSTNTSLTCLSLFRNKIKEKGGASLFKALRTHTSLTYLYLFANKIGNDGAKEAARMLAENSHLQSLDLGGNNIGDKGIKEMMYSLFNNTSLQELNLNLNDTSDALTRDLYQHPLPRYRPK